MLSLNGIFWNRANGYVILVVCVFLAAITWLVFGQTLRHDFVNYDDNVYVYENPHVMSGVTAQGIKWAFTHIHSHNWHPLTTISHLVDCQLHGQNPSGHHFTNGALHAIAVLLLFLVLRAMTATIWRSAFVAAVFAIHPLHVESVAWVSERKDVLSAVFFMLTLAAYVHYTRKQTVGRNLTMTILFACGLMSKPMLVTVPFVLLLLDYWPLKRVVDFRTLRLAAFEKVPLLTLSIGSCLATISAQGEAVGAMARLPLRWRLDNALVGYMTYIAQTLWPVNLAVFYPHPEGQLPWWEILVSIGLLIGISAIAIALRKTRPYIVTGWFWYLGMLVPVIGVFQIGMQGHADRYTYLPQIGLVLALTWGIADLGARWRYRQPVLVTTGVVIIVALAACARKQTSYWKNSETLWTHALAVTSDNALAYSNLGQFYEQRDLYDLAIPQLEAALKIEAAKGEARYSFTPVTHYNLGNALFKKGRLDEAIPHYEKALQLRPDDPDARCSLGAVLFRKGQFEQASAQWQKALSIQPDNAEIHTALGLVALRRGLLREAIGHYEKAVEALRPSPAAANNLAWILSTWPDASFRDGPRAVELARQAVQLSEGKNSIFLRTLAAAYAEAGRFNDAIEAANRGLQLANAQRDTVLANELHQDIDLYGMNFPLREHSPGNR